MEKEIWRKVVGYEEHYEVSSLGRVRSLDRVTCNRRGSFTRKGRVLNGTVDLHGYKIVGLRLKNKGKTFKVHQLVAITFLGHKPDGHKIVVDHINNIKTDNRLENLQLISARENTSKDRKGSSKYTGVSLIKSRGKWQSMIQISGKQKSLGCFDTEEEASQYYQDALKSIEEGTEVRTNVNKKSSKYKGVTWDKQMHKWRSSAWINGKTKFLGLFNCETAAYLARQAKLSQLSVEN